MLSFLRRFLTFFMTKSFCEGLDNQFYDTDYEGREEMLEKIAAQKKEIINMEKKMRGFSFYDENDRL